MSDSFRLAFSANFNRALDRAGVAPSGQGRVSAVANLFGISKPAAQKWLTGAALPELARFPDIMEKLGVTSDELVTGRFATTSGGAVGDVVSVGIELDDGDISAARFPARALELARLPPGVAFLRIASNEMEPFVCAGDFVLYASGQREIEKGGVFVLSIEGKRVVRRLQQTLSQTLRIICDNHRFPSEEVPLTAIDLGVGMPAGTDGGPRIRLDGLVVGRLLVYR
ncbi:MAG TPA: S24 family peptidase [Rhodocyclaceae bacterium]|nr:S24 family peptidase [Rhodocyclaceae bacterium]HNH34593.1 S24 family peptidase [Rhodocyclaceae bacterium]